MPRRKQSPAPPLPADKQKRADYAKVVTELKERIRTAQLRAATSVNRELVMLYWQIGADILRNQSRLGWGAKVIDRLSRDLRLEFPKMGGFSPRNLKYMRAFAEAWPDDKFVQQAVAQIPWGHNVRILDQIQQPEIRKFYVRKTIENGWSRDVLELQIENSLHLRQGKAVSNFKRTLPDPQSDLAQQILKDPYSFDFLTLSQKAHERELEGGLISRLRDFLLELGVGFSFVGSQHRIEVGGDEFFIDLLFYHMRLRCFVVIDLKMQKFQPEFAGKMSFYLSAVDDLMRHKDDRPSIGIILCKTRNETVAEYTLRDTTKPIGVSSFTTKKRLPAELKSELPSIGELERELESVSVKE